MTPTRAPSDITGNSSLRKGTPQARNAMIWHSPDKPLDLSFDQVRKRQRKVKIRRVRRRDHWLRRRTGVIKSSIRHPEFHRITMPNECQIKRATWPWDQNIYLAMTSRKTNQPRRARWLRLRRSSSWIFRHCSTRR
jgi:hypothetical protein